VRALGLDRTSDGFEYALDGSVLAFTIVTSAIAALLSSVPPVIAVLRDDIAKAVREGSRQTPGGRGSHILRNALVVTQIGVSLALLVGAGLLGKSFYKLQSEGPGFDTTNVCTAAFALPSQRYDTPDARARFQSLVLERLRALPSVTAAGFTSVLPFSGTTDQGGLAIDGYELPPGAAPPHTNVRVIDEGFLPSLGIAVTLGRNFAASEPEPVVIVDANLADKYWPGGRALGQRVRLENSPDRWYTIVGVIPAVKDSTLADKPTKETVYWHYAQRPSPVGAFTLRTTLPPEQTTRAAKAAVASVDPELALFGTLSMEDRVLRSLGPQRAPMVLSILFAAAAVLLATIGVYGVLTWAVTQRVGEIGVRVALGARAADIVRMILEQGGRLTAIGLVSGAVGAVAIGRALASQLRDVSALDPTVMAGAVGGLLVAAAVASWWPARRAARIDPMVALREQ
jgi:predicted permease